MKSVSFPLVLEGLDELFKAIKGCFYLGDEPPIAGELKFEEEGLVEVVVSGLGEYTF